MDKQSRPVRRVAVKPFLPQVYRLLGSEDMEQLALRWSGPIPVCYRLENEWLLLIEQLPSPIQMRLLNEYGKMIGHGPILAAGVSEYGRLWPFRENGSASPAPKAQPH